MSVRLKDTIYDLINNSDKLDGKHAADFATSGHTHYSLSTPGDQRSVTTTPNTYSNKFIFQGLKTNSTFGKPSTDTYSYVMGLRGWSDSSGGNSWEIAFNNSGINVRNGATDTWSNWFNVLTSNNSEVSLSGSTLTVKINGVTKSLTNTNTTYSAGSGLSLSGTTFNHASTVTAGTVGTSSATSGSTLAVPYVTYNATGHITATDTHTHTITGFAASSHTHSTYLPKLRMENPDPGHASIGALPFILSLKAAGTPLYGDPEFASGNNSVNVYNNASNGAVTITRIADNQYSANSSGYILQISTSATTATPGRGGFVQNMTSRAGAIFCQIFRAKIPTGYTLANAENSMGSSYKTHWLTSKAGTGKWEWYCRVTFCGTSGTFSGGGHVYLNADAGGTAAVTWYLSYCNTIDLTKANYDGLRSIYSDKLGTNAGSATNPVYFSGGKPVACTYSLNKTVPSNAVFTDTNTTYSAGSGLSLSGTTFNHAATVTAGTSGTSSATSGSTLAVPYVTVNATGHVTGYGTHTHTVTGFASSSHTHTTIVGNYTSGGGKQNPNYFGVNRVGALMMNTTVNGNSQYKDWLFMDCYSGSDVGGGVAIGVNRQALGVYIMRSAAARTSWAESAELLGTHNWSTYCAAKSHTHDYAATSHTHGTYHSSFVVTLANTTTDSGWSMINSSYNAGFLLKSIRTDASAPAWIEGNYAAGICFGGADTKGVVSCAYNAPYIKFAGGNGTKPVWWIRVSGTSGTTYNFNSMPYASSAGNADTVDGYHASSFAQASHTHNYAASSHTHSYAGSSSAGGAATSANKLNTNAGGSFRPVYFSGGIPVAGCRFEVLQVRCTSSSNYSCGHYMGESCVTISKVTYHSKGRIQVTTDTTYTTAMIWGVVQRLESTVGATGYITVDTSYSTWEVMFSDDESTNWGTGWIYVIKFM